MISVHFLNEKIKLPNSLMLRENVKIFTVNIQVKITHINFGYKRVKVFIPHVEMIWLSLSRSLIMQALMVNPNLTFTHLKTRCRFAF